MTEDHAGLRWDLGPAAEAVDQLLETWTADRVVERLWAEDHTIWSADPLPELTDRLGWLKLPESMADAVAEIREFGRRGVEPGDPPRRRARHGGLQPCPRRLPSGARTAAGPA